MLRCLEALAATDWDPGLLEIVVVDNASADGSADAVADAFPAVRLVRAARNLGFAGASNLALRDLGASRYAALVNNDALVDPGWLAPLVRRLEADPGLGAACPKVLLAGSYAEIELDSRVHVRGRGDPRPLGIRILGIRSDGEDVMSRSYFADGFHGPERDRDETYQWTAGRARLLVPVGASGARVELRTAADRPEDTVVRSGGLREGIVARGEPAWVSVPAKPLDVPVVNSAGAAAVARGFGGDRGFLEPDRGQYDKAVEVPSWSGAAVLLSRPYLEQVGLFDERLFLYYEDFDLAWRGRLRGWRYAYVPASVVRHAHASSTGPGSALFDHYNERNRLIVHTKNASAAAVRAAVGDSLYTTALHVKRDVVARALAGERPDLTFVRRRVRATLGYGAALPYALRERRRLRREAGGGVDTV